MERRTFKCPHCNKGFHCSSHLTTHVRTHTGEKPYQCGQCPKSFALLGNLTAHVRTHTGEKPYTCKYCAKSFTQSTNLNVHMRVHTGERPYKCQRCQKAFKTSGALNGHAKSCWKFSDSVAKHLPGFRRNASVTAAASRSSAYSSTGNRGRGIGKLSVALGAERSRISLPVSGTTSSKSSSHAPNEINNSQMSLSGNSNFQNYRRKLSAYFNKKRINLAGMVHNRLANANRPQVASVSSTVAAEGQTDPSNVVSSISKRLRSTIKQEEAPNSLKIYTEPRCNQNNQPDNQKTDSSHLPWKKEISSNPIISSSSSSSSSSSGFVNSSNMQNKVDTNNLSNVNEASFSSVESKNFTLSSDFSQPPQVRSDKGNLTIDFNSVSALNRNANQLNLICPVATQSSRVSGLLQVNRPMTSVLDHQARSEKLVGGKLVKDINTSGNIQSSISLLSKGSQETRVYMPFVSTANAAFISPKRSMSFGSDKVPLESPVVALPSSASTSNQLMEKKAVKNYFSDKQIKPSCTVDDGSLKSTSDTPKNINVYSSKNMPYHKLNPSKVSDNAYSSFVATSILEKVFKCRLCSMIFDRMDEFVSHMPLHEEDELLVCKFCELDFMTPLELVLHMKSHVLPQQLCELCDQMILSTRFAAHLSMHAASMKKMQNQTRMFWCRFCDKTFNQQAYLDLHLRVHTSQKPIHFNSTYPKTTTTATMVSATPTADPKMVGSNSTQKVFSCLYCRKEFQNSKNLIIHIRSHAVSNPHKCKKCHQIFKNMITYNTHKRSCFQDQKHEPQEFSPSSFPAITATTMTATLSSDSTTKAVTSTVTAVSTLCTERIQNAPEATRRPNSLSNLGITDSVSNLGITDSVVRPSSAPHSSSHISIQPHHFNRPTGSGLENALKTSTSIDNSNHENIPYLFQKSQLGNSSENIGPVSINQREIEKSENDSGNDSNDNVTELVIASVTGGTTEEPCEEKTENDKTSSENVSEKLDDSLKVRKTRCFLCSEEFLSKSSFSQHLQCVHDASELACKICSKSYSKVNDFVDHLDYCEPSPAVQVKCVFCSDIFSTDSDYNHHKEQKHGSSSSDVDKSNNPFIMDKKDVTVENTEQKDLVSCKVCSKQFPKLYNLAVHMRTHHSQRNINLNKCRYCERTFTSMSHLYVHHMKAHDRSQSLRCKYCKKPFKNWTRLKTHLRTHTGERPYECKICAKSFSQHGNLTAHTRTHTGEKPYKCKYCEKSFTQSTNLNVHKRVHTNERPYLCHMCTSAFKTSGARNSHLRGCRGSKGKNKGLPLFRSRIRGRQLKRKLTNIKSLIPTSSEGSLLDNALISESSLEQDSSTSYSNQSRKNDAESSPPNKKLPDSKEEKSESLNVSSSASKSPVLQQSEMESSEKLPEKNRTEIENDFQFSIESEPSDSNNKEQLPTIQGFYRNQFCNENPSQSESSTFAEFPTPSDKEGTAQISQSLHSTIKDDDIADILENHKATSSDNNPPRISDSLHPEHPADVNKDNEVKDDDDDDDVVIADVDTSLGTVTQTISLNDENLSPVEEFTKLSNTSHPSSDNIYDKKETLDVAENLTNNFPEMSAGRFLYPDNDQFERSEVSSTATSLYGSQASPLNLDNYIPSQAGSQFAIPYNAANSETYASTEPISKIGSQSVNSLYSDQEAMIDQTLVDQGSSFLFNCSKCSDIFTSASDYTEHMISHRMSSGMIPSTSYVNLQSNSSQEFDPLSSPLDQTYANQQQENVFKIQTTTMDQYLQQNSSDHNAEDSKTQLIQCKLCPKRFTKLYSLAVHMKTHTQQEQQLEQPQQQQQQQLHKCKICTKMFLTEDDHNEHLKNHHSEFPCNFCSKVCYSSSQLETHLRTHTGEKPFCCPHCPKTFAVNCNLIAHVRIHTGEKPFRCQYCDKSFTQATNLNVHTRIHTGERPYNCNSCKRAFRTSSALKGHVKCCSNQIIIVGGFNDK